MADYHFNVTQIKRSAGQSAVACAAYRAGEKLHSDYYGEDSDYTKKKGVVTSGILLPSHAPAEYADRETLWNAVEKAEKHPKAQLAYSFDFSLQNEFSLEENIAIAREFIQKNFVDRGMIADYAIHMPDREDGEIPNPHVHVMCPIRPLNADGTWGEKQRRVYRLDENGNRIRDADGKYLFDAVPTTDWGTPETLEQWRRAWADINNEHFAMNGINERIDHRSYERQGIDRIPMIHEGPNVREMEKKGIRTEKGERNRWIRYLNDSIRQLGERLHSLTEWIASLRNAQSEKPRPSILEMLAAYYDERNSNAWSFVAKNKNLKEYSRLVAYLEENGITDIEDLDSHIRQINEKSSPVLSRMRDIRGRIHDLDNIEKAGERYMRAKPFYDEWCGIFFKKRKEKYRAEHEKEIKAYFGSRRQAEKYLDDKGDFDADRLYEERDRLITELDSLKREKQPVLERISTLNTIRKAISQVSGSDGQDERKEEQDRETEERKQSQRKTDTKKEDHSLE